MLWNEWHACANSRRPDISKVCTFSPLDPKVSPLARSEGPLAFVGRMRGWQGKSKMSKVTGCV